MFAVIKTGGKQYKVAPGDKIKVEKLKAKEDGSISFDEVMLVADGDNVRIGKPFVEGVMVEASVVGEGRDKKKIVFKYHSKTRYKKKRGHRQPFTEVEIGAIKG
ncbi:MAG: 50S ribosomal protein L21 [Candidatus Harrisonbacteria bacterium CG10_big_fil_rev_8_21_14_0_10_42_17]|uniref:Large ribosomal subunit protein bL21 n=1 Tax=Candidatus Harrisonbacteria bacterium CG10_big_fil_rev_8_21_14_0_10_42_17 TaxID=1974584 RepID=A0A2M6WGX1_9BACT|nr:MAG: 50S ribosomal protein L21 [Candidatus Harrisonbacteria bacterium CG10_big_fil_rev_8_21_14_0_10_42_17]